MYSDTTAGLAATTSGQYFSVPSADSAEYLILYKNNAGSALEVKRYPSAERVDALADQVDSIESSRFTSLFTNNQFGTEYYGSSFISPSFTVSGTTAVPVTVDGVPAIKMTSRLSDGGGGVRYTRSASFLKSSNVTVGLTILSSGASAGISRITTTFLNSAGGTISTQTQNESFAGTTTPLAYQYTYAVPVGTASIIVALLAYGSAGVARETVYTKLLLADGEQPAFVPPDKVVPAIVYIAPTGSDTAAGTSAAPLASLAAAITAINGRGTVVVKSGDYTYSTFALNYATVKDVTIAGVARNLTDKRPVVRFGYKLAGITSESGKVYKADATGAAITSVPNWIWHDNVADAQTLVPAGEHHGLLRGRANRLPCTKIVKTTATTTAAAIAEIQAASVPKCFYDTSTKVMYFSIAGGGDATSSNIYVGKDGVDGVLGSYNSATVSEIGTSGRLRLRNLDLRYMGVNLRTFIEWDCYNVSVLGGRINNFDYAGNGSFAYCESMGAQGGNASGGDGFNAHDYAVATLRACYTHDNNDDGESCHENCAVECWGCVSEYNGSAGFIPAAGGHGRYHGCTSRKNGQKVASGGFAVTGAPGTGDDGVETSSECFNCISIGDYNGFNAPSSSRLDAFGCLAIDPTTYGYSGVTATDCAHSGTGTARSGGTVVAATKLT